MEMEKQVAYDARKKRDLKTRKWVQGRPDHKEPEFCNMSRTTDYGTNTKWIVGKD